MWTGDPGIVGRPRCAGLRAQPALRPRLSLAWPATSALQARTRHTSQPAERPRTSHPSAVVPPMMAATGWLSRPGAVTRAGC
jgi:hypothetical protein